MNKLNFKDFFENDVDLENVNNIINESLGTLQLDGNNLSALRKFVERITFDILNRKYATDENSNRTAVNIKNYISKKTLSSSLNNLNDKNLYHIAYSDDDISELSDWITHLDVIIDETPYSIMSKKRMVTFGEVIITPETVISTDTRILNAPLIIISPNQNRVTLKYTIAHELNHLYVYWKQCIINKVEYYKREEIRLSALISKISKNDNYKYANFNEPLKNIDNIINDSEQLKLYLTRAIYYLSNAEMSAHKENIYGEFEESIKKNNHSTSMIPVTKVIRKMSKTFDIYCNIRFFLEYLKENLSLEIWNRMKWDGQDTNTDYEIDRWKSNYLIDDRDSIMSYDEFNDEDEYIDEYELLVTINDIANVFTPKKAERITRADFLASLYNRSNRFMKNIWKMYVYCLKIYG